MRGKNITKAESEFIRSARLGGPRGKVWTVEAIAEALGRSDRSIRKAVARMKATGDWDAPVQLGLRSGRAHQWPQLSSKSPTVGGIKKKVKEGSAARHQGCGFAVLGVLLDHCNSETGLAWPCKETMGEQSGASP
ncbi:hypothetical protein ACTTAM_20195 (plasmid) [Rhodobacter capsulatus]|uniref:hypothetical protein n=1 Tax=Rhodobacter capsulatus TaxID=1061 RepID=UPI00402509FD